MKYRCIKEFYIPECDGDGFELPNKYIHIEAGSEWQQDNSTSIAGGEIHLECTDGYIWIEISREHLEESFEKMEV